MAKKKKNRVWLYVGIGVLVMLILVALVFGKGENARMASVSSPEKATITEIVAANGVVQPEIEVKISSEVSGEIVELLVKEGDSVKAGQLLLQVNPDISQSNVDRAKASVENARANYEAAKARKTQAKARRDQAKNNFDRIDDLWKDKVVPKSEWETAKAEYQSAEGELAAAEKNIIAAGYTVKSLESTLSGEKKNLQRTSIYAPMDGIVSLLSVERGERIVGSMQMTGTELLRIADFSTMELQVDVGESDIIRVSLGDTATIEVDAYNRKEFTGIVTEVANSAKNRGATAGNDQATNFEVKISILHSSYADLLKEFPNKVSPFLPGMSGMAEIHTSTVRDVLAIPIECVTTRVMKDSTDEEDSDEPKEVVFVVDNGIAKMKKVKTGIQDNKNIQVLEGLSEKDQVITGPYSLISKDLKEGDAVIVMKKSNLFKKPD